MKSLIIPTMLVKTQQEAEERLHLLGKAARWIQWDITNHTLTPTTCWADASIVKTWHMSPFIELHLMVDKPEPVIRDWREVKKVKRVIWHVEAPIDHLALIRQCKRWKLEVGIAISPQTPLASLIPFLRSIDCVLVLGVIPGKNGQPLIPTTLETVKNLKRISPKLSIGFDGGITSTNLTRIARAGVTRLNMGSGLFQTPDPRKTLLHFQKRLQALRAPRSRKT